MDRHLLFDRAFHAHEPDAELVLEKLAHRANTAIAQMIDVVRFADALSHLQDVSDHINEVGGRKCLLFESIALGLAEFDVGFQPSDAGEIELSLVKEHSAEKVPRCQNGRRIAGSHLAIDFEDGIARSLY